MKPIYAVPATAALVYRAYSHKSLTPLGIVVALFTAIAHAVHPWNLPFILLAVFFLAGSQVTKVKKDVKASLTLHAHGSAGGEGPRTHVQVLANSLMAAVLSVLHAYQLRQQNGADDDAAAGCFGFGAAAGMGSRDLLMVGIVANYAAVCADTFSSELGILARTEPRLITSPTLRRVPRGTNGGVTLWGLVAGFLGSLLISAVSVPFLTPFCGTEDSAPGSYQPALLFAAAMTAWGTLGSLLDSFLGGWLQRSVRDTRSGKIVEGEGGSRVLISAGGGGDDKSAAAKQPTRVVESGIDLLTNNEVNFLMAFTMTVGAVAGAAWYAGLPLEAAWKLS